MPRAVHFRSFPVLLALATVYCLLPAAAEACSRCGYAVCRYSYSPAYYTAAPYVAPSYDYTDHRFQVTYNVTFPPPAVSGATAYAYTPPTLSLLDPALYLNSASRYLELSQATSQQGFGQFSQTSQLILQGQQGVQEVTARERLLEKAAQLVAASGPNRSGEPSRTIAVEGVERLGVPLGSRHLPGEAPPLRAPGVLTVESVVASKCIRCHGPDVQKAGLRLDNLASLDARYEGKIIAKILADDPADRMPPPGAEKLTLPEKLTFLRASGLCGKKE